MCNKFENENEVLKFWEDREVFERLRARNAGGPKFLLLDGPMTANNPMGVHHAWGRTLKDFYQRYYGLKGFRQRYQNGFDCQGLWVEVEVEKSLGLNSKAELADFGLENFVDECKKRVAKYSEIQTQQSKRLGQWMDWNNSYYTMSDSNVECNWRFLKLCHDRGLLFKDNRLMHWCSRCSTSLSQHEQTGAHTEMTHTAAYVLFDLKNSEDSLLAWTTQPWTLAANMALGVDPDADYVCYEMNGKRVWMTEQTWMGTEVLARAKGSAFVDADYEPLLRFDAVEGFHKVVSMATDSEVGTGVVHVAPACGEEDWALGKEHNLTLAPVLDEQGRFLDQWGSLSGMTWQEASAWMLLNLKNVVRTESYTHQYPTCWRCHSELTFRLSEEWFLRTTALKEQLWQANEAVTYRPAHCKRRMEDWLERMGDWCVSRKRYWGLPLPFYHCTECDELVVVESKAQLEKLSGREVEELHRPYLDEVTVPCPKCAKKLHRTLDVGDCWLDAGVVPFSTLGYKNLDAAKTYADGASRGLSGAKLPVHSDWEDEFNADLVVEMREQVRLWFYSMLVVSVVFEGVAPFKEVLTYERVADKNGNAMHKSLGNAVNLDEAVEEVGADALRFMYLSQPPTSDMRFDLDSANAVNRKFATLRNVLRFFTDYRQDFRFDPERYPESGNFTDRWLMALTEKLVSDASQSLDERDHTCYSRLMTDYLDSLSNTYLKMNRRRFWQADVPAQETLAWALMVYLQLLSPAMPFMCEELYKQLLGSETYSDSVHLLLWPESRGYDAELLDEMNVLGEVFRAVRKLRAQHERPLRQPLRSLRVSEDLYRQMAPHMPLVCSELNLKSLDPLDTDDWVLSYQLNFAKLGPVYGKSMLEWDLEQAELVGDSLKVSEDVLLAQEEFSLVRTPKEGLAGEQVGAHSLLLDTRLDKVLEVEGLMRNALRELQRFRQFAGFEAFDRVRVFWQADGLLGEALCTYGDHMAEELLATSFERRDVPDAKLYEVQGHRMHVQMHLDSSAS